MTDLKITIDQLKNYLGTGLKFQTSKHQFEYGKASLIDLNGLSLNNDGSLNIEFLFDDDLFFSNRMNKIFPVMYRLSDLNKEIEVDGERFVPMTKIENDFNIEDFTYELEYLVRREDDGNVFISLNKQMAIMQKLFEWHFWLFGVEYFEQGLVIDKMKQK